LQVEGNMVGSDGEGRRVKSAQERRSCAQNSFLLLKRFPLSTIISQSKVGSRLLPNEIRHSPQEKLLCVQVPFDHRERGVTIWAPPKIHATYSLSSPTLRVQARFWSLPTDTREHEVSTPAFLQPTFTSTNNNHQIWVYLLR
jgi:hypothetical protein